DSIPLSYGYYGILGIPSPANNPPALYEAANWTDANGNFWLFGGVHYSNFNMYADLWKYTVATNQWTWVKGPGLVNQPGIYGIQGISSSANNPGARAWGAATWVDPEGNLWLFGGSGIDHSGNQGRLNDLWKYDVVTNQWSWIKGANTINGPSDYGLLRTESPSNQIPARDESSCTWTINNEFWIFGGVTNSGLFNDLWRYNWFTNNWTWMKGGEQLNQSPHHGMIGVADEFNDPGGRFAYCSWLNCETNLLFFGGENSKTYNDLWLFNRATNYWTWIDGSSNPNPDGNPGEYCEEGENFNPAGRTENRARWRDEKGNLWLFGGFKMGAPVSIYSDLWRYNPGTRNWALINGTILSNREGQYGTQSVAASTNIPRSRGGAVSWMDTDGNFWMFGGLTIEEDAGGYPFVTMNDLWQYQPDEVCFNGTACDLSIVPEINVSDSALCTGQCIDFIAQSSISEMSYYWNFEGAVPDTSTQLFPEGICYLQPGNFDVRLISSREDLSDTLILYDYIHVYDFPDTPSITITGNLLSGTSSVFYQWQLNGINIPGATNQQFTAHESGNYTIVTTNKGGCWREITISLELTPEQESSEWIIINPTLTLQAITIVISGNHENDGVTVNIFNVLGQQIYNYHEKNSSATFKKEVDLSMLPAGIYFALVTAGSLSRLEKIVLAR
ncbi:MAG: kelch repeat-containing protein, partial [Chitinophagales bacterium]